MRTVLLSIVLHLTLTCIADSAPLSEVDLKNLLAAIRQNRTTQADFQEQRMIRLMKKPILSSGKVWFQPPNKDRKSTRLNSSHEWISYAVFCLKKKKKTLCNKNRFTRQLSTRV